MESEVGQIFGRWIVISQDGASSGRASWLCRCDCGAEKRVLAQNLRSGASKSCGCAIITHGSTSHSLFQTWRNMIARCYNPKASYYHRYGGRGITVCEEWRHDPTEFIRWAEEESNCSKDAD